jgi:hypothetical protein
MLNKTKSILAISSLVIGLSVSGPTFAGGNSTPNASSTPAAVSVTAAFASVNPNVVVTNVVQNTNGSVTISTTTGPITVSSAAIANFLLAYVS